MKAFRAGLLAGLCLLLAGCPAVLGSLLKSQDPSFLQASRGKGTSIHVDWAAPTYEDEDGKTTKSVVRYNVYRDGTEIDTTTGTGYTDHSALAGHEYSYAVDADLNDGTTTGKSNSDTGWYVPAEDLAWDGTGVANHSGTGWFETLVVEGWTYHMTVGSTTVTVHDHKSPSQYHNQQPVSGTWLWTASLTGRVWIDLGGVTDALAWHD